MGEASSTTFIYKWDDLPLATHFQGFSVRLSKGEKNLLETLEAMSDQDGYAHVLYSEIAIESDYSERQVMRLMRTLTAKGIIEFGSYSGRSSGIIFQILLPKKGDIKGDKMSGFHRPNPEKGDIKGDKMSGFSDEAYIYNSNTLSLLKTPQEFLDQAFTNGMLGVLLNEKPERQTWLKLELHDLQTAYRTANQKEGNTNTLLKNLLDSKINLSKTTTPRKKKFSARPAKAAQPSLPLEETQPQEDLPVVGNAWLDWSYEKFEDYIKNELKPDRSTEKFMRDQRKHHQKTQQDQQARASEFEANQRRQELLEQQRKLSK